MSNTEESKAGNPCCSKYVEDAIGHRVRQIASSLPPATDTSRASVADRVKKNASLDAYNGALYELRQFRLRLELKGVCKNCGGDKCAGQESW
jgi:hypothetical protein